MISSLFVLVVHVMLSSVSYFYSSIFKSCERRGRRSLYQFKFIKIEDFRYFFKAKIEMMFFCETLKFEFVRKEGRIIFS